MRGRRVSRDLCKKAMYVNPKVQDKRASLLRRTKTTNAPDFIHTHTRQVSRDMHTYVCICFYYTIIVFFFYFSNFLQRRQFYNIFTSKSQSNISTFNYTHRYTVYACSFCCGDHPPFASKCCIRVCTCL